jgi:hypothetical protein
MDGVVVFDREGLDNPDGDAERVEGGLATVESAFVESEVVDPVRRTDAASLGRPELADDVELAVPDVLVDELALILIRAASWLSDGSLGFEGLSGF